MLKGTGSPCRKTAQPNDAASAAGFHPARAHSRPVLAHPGGGSKLVDSEDKRRGRGDRSLDGVLRGDGDAVDLRLWLGTSASSSAARSAATTGEGDRQRAEKENGEYRK